MRQFLVLLEALGQGDPAEGAVAGLVLTPGVTGQVAAHHHFHLIGLAAVTDGNHGIHGGHLPVGNDVGREVQELGGDLVQDLSFVGDAFRKDHIEGRDTVCGYHDKISAAEAVHVADFSRVFGLLSGKLEIGFDDCFHRR